MLTRRHGFSVLGGRHGQWYLLVFFSVPVAPGRSRVIWAFPRNVGVWLHNITPRWLDHVRQNLILDSDIFLLHVEVTQVLFLSGTTI